jgi:hypothetical protein
MVLTVLKTLWNKYNYFCHDINRSFSINPVDSLCSAKKPLHYINDTASRLFKNCYMYEDDDDDDDDIGSSE